MSSLIPISTYNLALSPFAPVPAIDSEYPVTVRITLAALDPEAVDDKAEPSTLRMLKRNNFIDEDSEDEFDEGSDGSDEEGDELDDEEVSKKSAKKDVEEEDEDEDSEDEDDEDSDDESDVSEYIICTLSPKTQYQQTIEFTISPEEEVYFVVTGSYAIHLTGNYVENPLDEDSEDEDDQYDLSPDEDEVYGGDVYDLEDLEDESDIENRIEELVEEEKKSDKKTNKRAAEEDKPKSKKAKKEEKKSVQFTKELEQGPTGSTYNKDAKKEDKKEKKEDKKEKKGKKVVEKTEEKTEAEEPKDKKFPTKTLLGGVVTEDRKIGGGSTAKSGNKVAIRYIGKLKNGKVFDKNTNGKPFSFGLGKGECIKGFDLGVAGMAVGGERRVVIPAKMGYGSQQLPGIPANSELTFDIKLVSLK